MTEPNQPSTPAGPVGGYGVELPPGVLMSAGNSGPNGQSTLEPSAVAAFVVGMSGILLLPCCYPLVFISTLASLFLGAVALQRIYTASEPRTGKGLAIAGMILGILPGMAFIGFLVFHILTT